MHLMFCAHDQNPSLVKTQADYPLSLLSIPAAPHKRFLTLRSLCADNPLASNCLLEKEMSMNVLLLISRHLKYCNVPDPLLRLARRESHRVSVKPVLYNWDRVRASA